MAEIPIGRVRPRTKRIAAHPCGQCGAITQRPKYCSWHCGSVAHRRRKGERPREVVNAERIARIATNCPICGTIFPAYSNRGGTRVCSQGCRHELRRIEGAKVRAVTQAKREFAKWARATKAKPAPPRPIAVKGPVHCPVCDTTVTQPATGRKLYCSRKCRRSTPAFVEARKAHRKKQKAAKRAVTVETVSPLKVFMRDGWKCHLCGGMTDKSKRGSLHPNAPELDHIVPIAKGGEHSYANTACAHKRCNAAKSDRILGQPSLLAA
jgi:5-methylcytosine-specific restriction endonuclease McrA